MKVLVVNAHPSLETSRVCRAWISALKSHAEVTICDLPAQYPDMDIDVLEEQKLLLDHDRIVLVFPLYWYSSPAILKQWFDLVMQPGFAYGRGGDKLHGKEWLVCTAIGSNAECYRAGNYNNFTIDELLRPLQQSVNYIGGKYLSPFCFYRSLLASESEIENSAKELVSYALARIDPKSDHEKLVNDSMDAVVSRVM